MPQKNLQVYQDMNQAIGDLKAGRIEAVWLGLLPAKSMPKMAASRSRRRV